MKPYYERNGIVIYNCDCRDVLQTLEPGSVDLVLTDPPYGIASVWKGGWGHGWERACQQSTLRNEWDASPPTDKELATLITLGKDAVIWGANNFTLPPSRGWLVWNKPERNFSLGEAELAWTSRDNVIRVMDCKRSDMGREHPTQKPLALMRWCLELFPNAQTILDPYCGSGTTLRAAKDLGRRAIGIEIEERYAEIAARRLDQEVLSLEYEEQGTRIQGDILEEVGREELPSCSPRLFEMQEGLPPAGASKKVR